MDELFEFDLSDVDVAAFESVATTPPHSSPPAVDTTNVDASTAGLSVATDATTLDLQASDTTIYPAAPSATNNQLSLDIHGHHQLEQKQDQDKQQADNNHHPQNLQQHYHLQPQQQQYPHQQQLQQHHQHQIHLLQQQLQSQQPQHQQLQHHVSQQIVSATGQQPCKILLIPINSANKPSNSGGGSGSSIKHHHLLQLAPGSSPLAMNALKTTTTTTTTATTASGNKKQIIQMTPKLEESFQTPPPPPTPLLNTNMIANEVPKRKPCNCTKSQCLKLYCDCFANGEFCSGCNCTNCFNSLSKEKERQKAIVQCLERNPEAFRPKIGKAVKSTVIGELPAPESIERRHTKGCNCKRSGCLKNYCECYEAKILCSNLCKCCGCKNYEESFERKSLMQLANSSSESARGILKNLLPTNNDSSAGGGGGSKVLSKCFITDRVIHASLACLLQSAQQAEKDGTQPSKISNLIQTEMGKCLRMIVDSATESSSPKKK